VLHLGIFEHDCRQTDATQQLCFGPKGSDNVVPLALHAANAFALDGMARPHAQSLFTSSQPPSCCCGCHQPGGSGCHGYACCQSARASHLCA